MSPAALPHLALKLPAWRSRLLLVLLLAWFVVLAGRALFLQGLHNDFLQQAARPEMPRRLPLRASEMPQPTLKIMGRPFKASPEEINANPRARSAILRVAERTAGPLSQPNTRIEPGARWRN